MLVMEVPFLSKSTKHRIKRALGRLRSVIQNDWQKHFVDYIVQTCFIIGISGVVGIGMRIVIPVVYSNYTDSLEPLTRIFGYFLLFQLLLNWLCIKCTDSSYKPSRDGIIPTGVSIGQDVFRTGADNNNARSRKDATTFTTESDDNKSDESNDPLEGNPESYLAWAQCVHCNRPRPPRSHHCPICDKCVLKRDHHCFFTGVCIGTRNMRHFTVFAFWSVVAGVFACVHMLPYYFYEILPYTSYFDIIVPIAFVRVLLGYVTVMHAVCILFGWITLKFLQMACIYLHLAVKSILSGKTFYELKYDTKIKDIRTTKGKIEAVFGPHWALNFLFPLHFIYEPSDDTVNWPTIEASNS